MADQAVVPSSRGAPDTHRVERNRILADGVFGLLLAAVLFGLKLWVAETWVGDTSGRIAYDLLHGPAEAIGLQPLACVLYACEQLPDLAGRHVAIIGQGSIGLLFSYVAKAAGARRGIGSAGATGCVALAFRPQAPSSIMAARRA